MDIAQQLIANFPNSVDKNSKLFGDIVANENKSGVMETILNDAHDLSKEWYNTPDIYQQSGEMFDVSAKFFTYFQRYTDESLDAYKERIRTIFQRNGDRVWGSNYDIQNVFKAYFKSGQIFIAENTNSLGESIIIDGDFQNNSDAWVGIDNDLSSKCHLSRYARFSLGKGVELNNGGVFSQEINIDDFSPESDYTVVTGDTYESIENNKFGNSEYGSYIANYKENPPSITGPVKGTTTVIFSRKTSINTITTVPTGTVVKSGDLVFYTKSEAVIKADDDAKKSKVQLTFYADHPIGEDELATIEAGTIVSDADESHKFITLDNAKIVVGQNYVNVDAEAIENGTDYNLPKETINKIISLDKLTDNFSSVINQLPSYGGENGTNLNSNPVLVEAYTYGPDYNVGANTINKFDSDLPDDIKTVNNENPVTNGCNASVIKIPPFNSFYLHYFLNGKADIRIIDDRNKYWNPTVTYNRNTENWNNGQWQDEEFIIHTECTTLYDRNGNIIPTKNAKKAVTKVKFFSGTRAINDGINIPDGTIVSDGNNKFRTLISTSIKRDETESALIEVECIEPGLKGNVPAESITIVESEIEGVIGCINPDAARGGTNTDWENISIPFTCTESKTVKIEVSGVEDLTCLDYFRLFIKQKHPSFTVIAYFSTFNDTDAAALFYGNGDKEEEKTEKKYENASYFDDSFISGIVNTGYATEIYEDLLNYLRASGVKAYIEIVNRDE